MRFPVIRLRALAAALLLAIAPSAVPAQTNAPGEAEFRALYKELVEYYGRDPGA